MQRMANTTKKKSTPLLYATLIAKILRTCRIIPLDGEEQVRVQEIGENTLSFLGYWKYQSRWVLKARRRRKVCQDRDEEMEEVEEEEETYDNIPPGNPSSPTSASTAPPSWMLLTPWERY